MEGDRKWRFCFCIFVLFSLNVAFSQSLENTVCFQPQAQYVYKYDGFTHLKDVARVRVSAVITITPLLPGNSSQLQRCRLNVNTYSFFVLGHGTETKRDMPDISLNKSIQFDVSGSGEIQRVYYASDEDPVGLNLKKTLLGTLSSKLVVSDSQRAAGSRWAYRVNETGHEGVHEAVYHARPLHGEIVFTKVVRLNTTMGIPSRITVKEWFYSPNELAPRYAYETTAIVFRQVVKSRYRTTMPEAREALAKGNSQLGMPQMGGTSTSVLMFVRANRIESSHENDVESSAQVDTMNSSLKVYLIPPSKCDLADLQKDFERNMSCIIKARAGEIHTGLPCFRHLVTMLKRLSRKDVDKLTMKCLRDKRSEVARQTMIDALGTAQTSDCYTVMMRRVLLTKRPEAELLMRALFQLFELSAPIPEIVFSTLEDIVFRHPFDFSDDEVTQQLNDRATLVLASVAKQVINSRPAWASSVVQRLEQRLGVHDPYHHRQLRSTMKEKELRDHLNYKTLHIHALGNAASDSSLGHLMSFVNDSDAHTNLRYSAVDALARYSHKHVADVLLSVALMDKEENVRFAAIKGYKTHPYGGDIQALLDPVYRSSRMGKKQKIVSDMDDCCRPQFGLCYPLQHLLKDSEITHALETPKNLPFHWNPRSEPLWGHMKVDFLDSAFATLHIGLIGFDFDIFRAEFCFKTGIEYELNTLKEFSYGGIKEDFDLFAKVLPKLVKTITTAVKSFKRLISTFNNVDFDSIIKGSIDSVKQMVRKVTDLRRIGSRVYKAVGKFDELPPVIMKVKNLVTRVTTLFKDIKNDVMGLYNAVADSINTVVPWAWKEIKTSFSGIVRAIPKLLKNPRWTIQKTGEAIVRISTAIAAVINAKKKVVEANIFTKENRPYWFDIKKEVTEIWDGVLDIKQSIMDTMESFNNDDDDIASRFTGVNLATMKKAALAEIKSVLLEELEEPMNSLKQLLEPYQQAQDLFVQLVKNIKGAWRTIVEGYQTIRTQLEQIFGPKVHEDFPRKLLMSSSCGDGFWETNGKGHYNFTGIMLEVNVSHKIVAPYGGRLRKTGPRQITISVSNMKNVEIIIDNVELNVDEKVVAAGEAVGRGVTPQWCSDTHIHVAMVKTGTVEEIDPTGYLRKRNMPPPEWVQNCDHYILHWKGRVTNQGHFMKGLEESDTTPEVSGQNEDLNIDAIEESDRKKRGLSDLLDTVNDFGQSLGLPDLLALKDVLSFNMNSIKLKTVLDFLGNTTQQKLKSTINKVLKEVEV
ncbi:hypothetical protein LSAT2_014923 [Lamellibrachia satsuma]|nr:hypothetical protein LSAT2_014923 [Lamellibrachia satsuma]